MILNQTPKFVSVHIIAKETTNFGNKLFKACLESLKGYPDELIIVDDGCSPEVRKMISDTVHDGFPSVKLISAQNEKASTDFTSLRQVCLKHTSPQTTFWHWIDTDEVYYPEQLQALKNELHNREDASAYVTTLWHFMRDPFSYQYQEIKRNVYRYDPLTKWNKTVHEHVIDAHPGHNIQTSINYLHLGYCRTQYETMIKWLRYVLLEHKNCDAYRREVVEGKTIPYLRDWRTPNAILNDRPVQKFTNHYPTSMNSMFEEFLSMKCTWDEYLLKIDPEIGQEWLEWNDKVQSGKATWADWIDFIIAKNGWKENQ